MKKLLIAIAVSIFLLGLSPLLTGQEKDNISNLAFSLSKGAKEKIKTIRTLAIFLNGNDNLLTRLAEDSITIHLSNAGYTVINREILDKAIGEQVAKKKREKIEGSINALEIAKLVGAEATLTGNLIIISSENQPLLVKLASFQLFDVESNKLLISMFFEVEKGSTLSGIARSFLDALKQGMK